MILAGALTMAAGQLVLALATDVPTAVAARVLVGAGDAMTFISVLRVIGAVVPRPHGSADHPAHRHPRPARLDRGGLPAGRAAARHARGGRRSSAPPATGVLVARAGAASPCATPRPARSPPAAGGPGRDAAQPGRHLARARHPDRALHPPGHPVLRHRVRAAVGLPVPRRGGGAARPATAAGLLTLLVVVGMGVGPLLGRLVRAVAAAPLGPGLRDPRRRPPPSGPSCCCWPGPRAAAAAGRARRRAGHQRPRLDDRLRLRPHRNPAERHGQRQRGGQRGRLRRLAAARSWRSARCWTCSRRARSTDYSLGAFRAAFAVQYVFWAVGLVGVLRHRRQLRARLARDGVVLAPLYVAVGARLRGGSAYR